MRVEIRKGLDIPLRGHPTQEIDEANTVSTVALLGPDYPGLRPGLAVQVGERVRLGQTLFTDKRDPRVRFTAPGSGEVVAINRGARRALLSVVIRVHGDDEESFAAFDAQALPALDADSVRENLLASGLWTAFRTRPFSRIPSPATRPAALFVTAIDTNPLAADPSVVIAGAERAFANGLAVIGKLTDGPLYVCTAPNSSIHVPRDERIRQVEFTGPHPAGLVGTHIHFLHPAGDGSTVWHLGYQDVIAIGRLMTSGRLPVERVVSLGGPSIGEPRLVRTRIGASIADLLRDEIAPGKVRLVSGSVLSGHRATGPLGWLGRYHCQVSVLREGSEREFLGWLKPGSGKFSSLRAYTSHLLHRGGYALTTSQNGSPRAMVPIGAFEKVMPLDVLPTPLLKALVVRDLDQARALGCLELDEEDLALCSFVCNGKYDYGPYLRKVLDELEREA
ncbi:MAG: Na(+)-translocating NADH-quinone reductase subunit A [Woeseiaceae bacterium]|nr:Na(+)-translocating NADH-quinone reductase subunit A [Woeseiaceae bacterium]